MEMYEPRGAQPVLVISPHLDDAVFGCGQLLATHPGSVVITALAGRPASYATVTPWDELAGFAPGEDVIAARRAEDQTALAILQAHPVWLDFTDDQYGDSPTAEVLSCAIEDAINAAELTRIYIPLGLFHNDHKLTHRACIAVLHCHPGFAWFAYEEPNYRHVPHERPDRLQALFRERVIATLAGSSSEDGKDAKRRAVAAYRSQLRALGGPGKPGTEDIYAPERYWRLATAQTPLAGKPRGGVSHDH